MVCAGGSLGILIPPSIMLVSMGSYANVSVGKIFFAAIVPGLVLSLFYMIYVFVICHIHPDYGPAMTTEELAAMPLSERITGSLINLIPPVILIVGVLGSIFTGWATPTEAAGVGALFSLILAIFYKQFSWKMLYDSLIDTAKTSAMVFIILFGAAAFTGVFMSLDGDQLICNLDFERWHRQVGRVRNHDGDRILYGHVHRLAGHRHDRVPHLLADHGYLRLRPPVDRRSYGCYAADLLHDAAVRLRTVLHQGALCRRRSKYRKSTAALSRSS